MKITRKEASKVADTITRKKTKLGVWSIVPVMYVLVSSGGWGSEDLIGTCGPGLALLMFILVPFIWAYPFSLIVAELSSAYPEEGGIYAWVYRILGKKAAFFSGWCNTLVGLSDPCIYVVLMVSYVQWILPFEMGKIASWIICVILIWIIAFLNIRGIKLMSDISTVASIIILIPFLIMTVMALFQMDHSPVTPFLPEGESLFHAAGSGMLLILWLNLGYNDVSSMAGEIEDADKVIPKAIIRTVPVVNLVYIISIFPALAAVGNWADWSSEGPISFVEAGAAIGGPILGVAFVISAVVSNFSLTFNYIGAYSRVPFVMSERNQFFKSFAKRHPKYDTPYIAIICTAVVCSIISYGSFIQIVDITMTLFAVPTILMFISAIKLRLTEPDVSAHYKVPLKGPLFVIFALIPTALYLYSVFYDGFSMGLLLTLTAIPAYFFFEYRNKKEQKED